MTSYIAATAWGFSAAYWVEVRPGETIESYAPGPPFRLWRVDPADNPDEDGRDWQTPVWGAVLTQETLDRLIEDYWLRTYEGESGGVIGGEGLGNGLCPALHFANYDMYRTLYVVPFPANYPDLASYDFADFERAKADIEARYSIVNGRVGSIPDHDAV